MFKLTCGYCLKQYKLQPWQQVHRKGDQLICPDCLAALFTEQTGLDTHL